MYGKQWFVYFVPLPVRPWRCGMLHTDEAPAPHLGIARCPGVPHGTHARSAACALRLRSASRKRYLPVIRENFPELSARYEATYRHSVYAADSYRAGLQQVIEQWCRKYGLTTREYRRDDGDADSEVALPEPLVPELQLVLL